MNPQKKLLACVVALTTFVCTFGQITIVDDAMTGTNNAAGRQAAPSSTRVQWFMGGNYSSTYGSGSLNVTNASAQVLGYFTAAGSPVQLAVGETLTATFTFKMTGLPGGTTADGQLRFGLLNSDTGTNSPNRISADVFSANNQFLGYTGYAAMMRVNPNATGNLALFERTNMTNNTLIGSSAPYTSLASTAFQALANNTFYTGTFSATRTGASALTMGYSMTGGSLTSYATSYSDASALTTAFDSFAINWATGTMNSGTFTLDSFSATVTAAPIPEPSTYAALAGVAALGLVIMRRRTQRSCRTAGV